MLAMAATFAFPCACDLSSESGSQGQGSLSVHFCQGTSFTSPSETKSSSSTEIPDTLDFLLSVSDEQGNSIYDGSYGDFPRSMTVDAGNYYVSVRSIDFEAPAFSSPEYGDDQWVVVPSGGSVDVSLECTLLNCGVKLSISSGFLTAYPDGVIFVRSDDGKLMYSYSESRIAYFNPGDVTVYMNEGTTDTDLFTRTLAAKEILSVAISVSSSTSTSTGSTDEGSISIIVDTSATWINTSYTIGEGFTDGTDSSTAMDITTAKQNVGAEDVWVYGYIVGCFKSSTNMVTEADFPMASNMAISDRRGETDRTNCLSVELKSGSTLREEANLVDNPDNLGRKIFLKGTIVESYYGINGIKSISDFEWGD